MTEQELVAKIEEIQADYHRQMAKAIKPYRDQLMALIAPRQRGVSLPPDLTRYLPNQDG